MTASNVISSKKRKLYNSRKTISKTTILSLNINIEASRVIKLILIRFNKDAYMELERIINIIMIT